MFPRSFSIVVAWATLAVLGSAATPAAREAPASAGNSTAEATRRLDALLADLWKQNGILPAPLADDATFLRRAWLDLAGVTPPVDFAQSFLADQNGDKRAALVETLFAKPEFADHWGGVLAGWAIDRRPVREDRYDGRVLRSHLRAALETNRPYDKVVRELITAEGTSDRSGPANFLLRYEGKPEELAGAVGRQFLGITLQCAQCHHHPMAKWTEQDFWGLAACFARLHILEGDVNGHTVTAIHESRRGELERPDMQAELREDGQRPTKKTAPRLLGADAIVVGNRREALADWLTSADNPYFARHAVNRVWEQFFGQRLVKSLDDWDAAASGENAGAGGGRRRILDLLAHEFQASNYDLKRLLRIVVRSRAYQLATGDDPARRRLSRPEQPAAGQGAASQSGDAPSPSARPGRLELFAIYPVKPLSVDQLYQSIVRATGYPGHDEERRDDDDAPEPTDNVAPSDAGGGKMVARSTGLGMKAGASGSGGMAAPAMAPGRERPAGETPVESDEEEASDEPTDWPIELLGERSLTLQRTLAMHNGDFLNEAVASGAKLAMAMRGDRSRSAQIEWLCLATLCRPPTPEEMAAMQQIQQAGKGLRGLEDVLWALLNSAEFNSQH